MRPLPNIELIAANAIFGVSYSLIMKLIEEKIPYELIFISELFVCAAIFIPIALLNPRRRTIAKGDILPIALCAVITIYGWNLLTLKAIETTSPIDMAAISTFGPAVTVVAAAISRYRVRRLAQRRHISTPALRIYLTPIILLLLVGVVILHEVPSVAALQNIPKNSVAVAAVICMGVSTVIISNLEEHYGTTTILAIYFAVALLVLPLLYPDFAQRLLSLSAVGTTHREMLLLAILPIFTTALPLYLLYRGALQLTPLHTALYRYIQPVIALTLLITQAHRGVLQATLPPLLGELATTLSLTLLLLLASTFLIPNHNFSIFPLINSVK